MSAATASAPGAAADAFGEILRSSAQPSPQEKRSSKTKDPFLIRTGQTAARRSRRRSRRTAQTCRKNSPARYFFDRLSCSAATCSSAIQIWKAGEGSGPNPPSGIVAYQQRPGKEPEPHKAYLPQDMAHPQSPMACTKRCGAARSPYPLTSPPSPCPRTPSPY